MIEEQIQLELELSQIEHGTRARKDYGDIEELKDSITSNGLYHPLVVMQRLDGSFELIAGGRRFRALTELGWKKIPCHVYPFIEDEKIRKLIELEENIIRQDLSYAERATLTAAIHDTYVEIKGERAPGKGATGHSKADTAKFLHRSNTSVKADIELARAIQKDPDLAKCKDQAEAMKLLAAKKEAVIVAEMARRAKEAEKTGNEKLQIMEQSYILSPCLDYMHQCKARSFNLIELDPPYGIPMRKLVKTDNAEQEDLLGGHHGINTPAEMAEYLSVIKKIFERAYKLIKKNGWLICWLAIDPFLDPFYKIAREVGFEGTRVPGFWIKNNGNTRTPNIHMANRVEAFLYFRKGNAMLAEPGRPNTFEYPIPSAKIHPTEKPQELYEDIIQAFLHPGSNIYSAFAGSGNIIRAAYRLGFQAIGTDMYEPNRDRYLARIYLDQDKGVL